MDRLTHLEALCLRMVYAREAELKLPDCNNTVITAIEVAKRAIYREVTAIAAQRKQPVSDVISQEQHP